MRALIILLVLFVSYKIRGADPALIVPFSIGVLLLTGNYLGKLLAKWKLPEITGYLLTGIILGPAVIDLINPNILKNLAVLRSLALVIISMMAGFEFNIKLLKKNLLRIFSLGTINFIFIFFGSFAAAILFFKTHLLVNVPANLLFVVSLVLAAVSTAKSPLSTIAIIEDVGIKNKFSSLILDVTIFKDIWLIFVFVALMFFLKIRMDYSTAKINLWIPVYELLGSIAVGIIFGLFLHFYFKFVNARNTMVLILIAFIVGEISRALHLNSLLFGLTIGFIVGNYSRHKTKLDKSLKESGSVILIIFFSLTAAWIKKEWLTRLWLISLFFSFIRVILIYIGVFVSESITGHSTFVKKYGWTGFINQSGVTLAIALLVNQLYPELGQIVYPIIIGMIVITDFLAPPLFKWALLKSKNEEI